MQFLWKYVDDLIGKGLEVSVLIELFIYAALSMFPLALPLSILLSSLMTFGNLGEHFELVALKSSGLSLLKIMMPLVFVAALTSFGSFLFSNNALPFINLKMGSLIYDIQQKKPAFNIKEKNFYNGIDGYTLRVNKKESDGKTCSDILIYDHTQQYGNNKVIVAETGRIEFSEGNKYMIITLFNGTSYEEILDKENKNNHPLIRSKFKEQIVRFDLSGFKMVRSDEGLFKSNYAMLTIRQINHSIDSLHINREKQMVDFKNKFLKTSEEKINITKNHSDEKDSPSPPITPLSEKIHAVHGESKQNTLIVENKITRSQTLDLALNLARSKKYFIESFLSEQENYDKPVTSLKVEWHKKFSLSFACFVLFFIGAPLGAIIRKGGLGMPVVVSVIFFIFFWVISISGEKMSKEGVLPPYIGMWMATAVTLPLGVFLTRKATSDSTLFDRDAYIKPFRHIANSKIGKWISALGNFIPS